MSDGSRTKGNMAGSVNSDEIEDVLSSIRRLVSEDLRPAPRPQVVPIKPAVKVQPEATAAPEKLILTPALRVVSRTEKPVVSAPPADAKLPRLHLGLAQEVSRKTPELVATLAQGVDQKKPLDWESETGDAEPDLESLDWSSFTFARRSMQETWAAQVVANEVAAPLAAHVEQAAAGWAQPDPGEAAPATEAPMAVDVPADWADEAEAEAVANLEQPTPSAQSDVVSPPQQEEDNIFSEQVLRELVRDLIREQLQGELGERITRNIRKLVRAEIAQAMTIHALE